MPHRASTRFPSHRTLFRLFFVVGLAAVLYPIKVAHRMPDYEVYRRAAVRARAAEPLYRAHDGHYQFKYLPAFAVAAVPLGLMPDRAARIVWFSGSVAVLAALLALSLQTLPERRKSTSLLVGGTCVLLAKFYAHELELGQVNLLLACVVVAAARLLRSQREFEAGLFVAAAIVVKPYAVLLVPYLLARGKLPSIAAVGAGLTAALVVPSAVYGFDGNLRELAGWWGTVTETTAPNLADRNNVSAAAVFFRLLGPGPTAEMFALLLVIALLGAAVFVFVRRRTVAFPEGLEIALLLTMMPILSPQGWDYVFLVSTLAVMYLVNYADALPQPMRTMSVTALLVIAFSIFDVMGRTAYMLFMSWSMITLCYLVVIAGIVALRVRRLA